MEMDSQTLNQIIGALIPLLMGGGNGFGDFMSKIGMGAPATAASQDFLSQMQRNNAIEAVRKFGIYPNQQVITDASDNALRVMGVNPYGSVGQSMSNIVQGIYRAAPDMVGGILGINNPAKFFTNILNGSGGIAKASGMGGNSLFDLDQVLANQQRASRLGREMYGFGRTIEGNTDLNYTHGLNVSEQGIVAQRILSSDLAYTKIEKFKDQNGEESERKIRLAANEVPDSLREWGRKLNQATSALSKITGSVDESMRLLDRLAGGNFLGGSKEDAENILRHSQGLVNGIRITAAMSGESPQQIYNNVKGMVGIAGGAWGLDQETSALGGADVALRPGLVVGMAMSTWNAQHPEANEMERARAQSAYMHKFADFASSGAEPLSTILAANPDIFSPEDQKRANELFRSGNADGVERMIIDRMGLSAYNQIREDPARLQAMRMGNMADEGRRMAYSNLFVAGIEGQTHEAMRVGSEKKIQEALSLVTSQAFERLNNPFSEVDYNENRLKALKEFARGKGLMTEEALQGYDTGNISSLETQLAAMPGVDAQELTRIANQGSITGAKNKIQANTMTADEEVAAKKRIRDWVTKNLPANASAELKQRLMSDDVGTALDAIRQITGGNAKEVIEKISGGKFFSSDAARMNKLLDQSMASLEPPSAKDNEEAEGKTIAYYQILQDMQEAGAQDPKTTADKMRTRISQKMAANRLSAEPLRRKELAAARARAQAEKNERLKKAGKGPEALTKEEERAAEGDIGTRKYGFDDIQRSGLEDYFDEALTDNFAEMDQEGSHQMSVKLARMVEENPNLTYDQAVEKAYEALSNDKSQTELVRSTASNLLNSVRGSRGKTNLAVNRSIWSQTSGVVPVKDLKDARNTTIGFMSNFYYKEWEKRNPNATAAQKEKHRALAQTAAENKFQEVQKRYAEEGRAARNAETVAGSQTDASSATHAYHGAEYGTSLGVSEALAQNAGSDNVQGALLSGDQAAEEQNLPLLEKLRKSGIKVTTEEQASLTKAREALSKARADIANKLGKDVSIKDIENFSPEKLKGKFDEDTIRVIQNARQAFGNDSATDYLTKSRGEKEDQQFLEKNAVGLHAFTKLNERDPGDILYQISVFIQQMASGFASLQATGLKVHFGPS